MRISVLTSCGLLAAQIAQELVKHGHDVTALAEPANMSRLDMPAHMSRLDMPSLKSVVPFRSAAPEFSRETFKGKKVAQWKRERNV